MKLNDLDDYENYGDFIVGIYGHAVFVFRTFGYLYKDFRVEKEAQEAYEGITMNGGRPLNFLGTHYTRYNHLYVEFDYKDN